MTSTFITEIPELELEVTEFDRIECDDCGKRSPFLDDGDNGTHEAHSTGDWHVLYLDECGCPNLCADCAEERCGVVDDSPRLFGMRVV
ncbi:hypothetical protein [Streptomyces decoyicus]|uniref:hypothetical protein n=1 Tax=Streptomyces decoyicus TaxID=249567 RepID=UPI0036590E49